MNKKIKVNIPNFGKRYCSNNVEYKLLKINNEIISYTFYKKGTSIKHNEYGPAIEWEDKSQAYYINNKLHSLNNPTYSQFHFQQYKQYIIGKFAGDHKPMPWIKSVANILIPPTL